MASSDGESDADFVPGEPEQLSEEDSADDETDLQYENEVENKNQKRKAHEDSNAKKKQKTAGRSTRNNKESENKECDEKEKKVLEENLDPEEEKKREDDLWAMFLEGTDTKPKAKDTKIVDVAPKPLEISNPDSSIIISADKQNKKEADAERERRIFEFAGETIVVEGDVIKEKIKTADNPAAAAALKPASSSKGPGGLSAVLGQLNKKNKLSTLEKTKLDWMTFKKQEGIEEELKSINKGKDGYLERQDFLERADHRQYEIERELRMSRRSNR